MASLPIDEAAPARTAYSFGQLADTGVLWLINRVAFHPHGLTLALDYAEGENEPRGWSVAAADDGVFRYGRDVDEADRARLIHDLFAAARDRGRLPLAANSGTIVEAQ